MSDKHISNGDQLINSIILYFPFFIIIFGTLGSFCNIIIFTSKQFRYNSCAFYMLCSTIFDLIYLLLSGITRIINEHFPHLLLYQSSFYCKFRTYLVVVTPFLSTYFLMFASIDRCLSTSTSKKWRNYSNINMSWRIAIFILIFVMISASHIIYFYKFDKKYVNIGIYKCIPDDGIYKIFMGVSQLLSNAFLIYMIILICTIITLIRLRRLRIRMIYLYDQRRNRRNRNIDRNLIIIIFVQVGLGMLFTFFRCGFLVYTFWSNNINKKDSKISLELFLDKISLIIYYMNFAKSFPVNILTTPLFRDVFYRRLNNLIR